MRKVLCTKDIKFGITTLFHSGGVYHLVENETVVYNKDNATRVDFNGWKDHFKLMISNKKKNKEWILKRR